MDDVKIGVLTGADSKQKNLLDITLPILEQYCLYHNYDLHYFTENVNNVAQVDGKSYFARYPFIKHHLKTYKWVFWIDADCLVMNFYKKLEDYINDDYGIILDLQVGEKYPLAASGHGFWKNDVNTHYILECMIHHAHKSSAGLADNEILNFFFTKLYKEQKVEFEKSVKLCGPGKDRIGHYDKEIIECLIHQLLGHPEGEFHNHEDIDNIGVSFEDVYTPGRDFLYHRSGVNKLEKRTENALNFFKNTGIEPRMFATKESDLKYHADRLVRPKIVPKSLKTKIDIGNWAYTALNPE
tara:strand:+ start:4407 stop:5297 length:891 start_codon:yes stop_codon:yes gene_type:complete